MISKKAQEQKRDKLYSILSNLGEEIAITIITSIKWFLDRGYTYQEAEQEVFIKYRNKLLNEDKITQYIVGYKSSAYMDFSDEDEFDDEKYYETFVSYLSNTFSVICDFSIKDNKVSDPHGIFSNIIETYTANEIVQHFIKEREYKEAQIRAYEALNESLETKSEKLGKNIIGYGFLSLSKISVLSEKAKDQLIVSIATNSIPYAIAMFDFLGFIKHLTDNYFKSKYQLHKEVSKWFNSDSDGRYIRGLLNHLHKKDSKRYTAHQHIKKVEEDYNNLK